MDNANIEKLTKELIAGSKLNLPDPFFDDKVMNKILLESSRINNKKQLFLNILVFIGIEFIIFSLVWLLLLFFPVADYLKNAISSSLLIVEKAGNFVLEYGYLIVSFILVGVLGQVLNKRVKVTLN